jgi:hypothetical protein
MPQPRKMLGLLALEPKDLAGGESWHQLVLKLLRQLPSLICTLHVAPQLCRADDLYPAPPLSHDPCTCGSISWSQHHLVVRVERHEAVLLSTDCNAGDALPVALLKSAANGNLDAVYPLSRILCHQRPKSKICQIIQCTWPLQR